MRKNIDNPSIAIAYKNCRPLISAICKKMANIEKALGINPRDVDAISPLTDPQYYVLCHAMHEVSEVEKEYRLYSDETAHCWHGDIIWDPTEEVLEKVLTVALAPAEYALVSSVLA